MASSDNLLTRNEAILYLTENLQIPDAELKLKEDPKAMLDSIVCSYLQRVPIQTITLHLVPQKDRRRPSWTTVKNNIINGIGGMCYELNVFMFALLKRLGYEVYLVDADVKAPSNHVMTVAKNVSTSGDLFLIDAGSGFPTFQAVDLTFEEESPVYQQSFLDFKFIKKDGRILRMHLPHRDVSSNVQEDTQNTEWKRYYDFELTPLSLDQLDERFDKVFEIPTTTSSHRVLRCTYFPQQKAYALRNNVIFEENECHILEEKEYRSDQALKNAICEVFTMFSDKPEIVEQSIKGWRKIVGEPV